jgi:polyisoprenoid-binding protein YceI
MKKLISIIALSILMALGAGLTQLNAQAQKTAAWVVDGNSSTIAWSTKWAGQNITGNFGIDANSAIINFDPKNLKASNVSVNINLAGFKTPSNEARQNLPLADWLNTKSYPIANFSASNFKATGPNTYFAQGSLSFKGGRYNLPLPFTLKINGNSAILDARVVIDRINIKVGIDSDAKAEWVDRNVQVVVHLAAKKK